MSDEQLRRLNLYLLAIAVGAIVAGGGVLQHQLTTTGEIDAAPILAAMLGALITGLSTSVLPALKMSAEQAALPAPADDQDDETYPVLHRECGRTAFIALKPPVMLADLKSSDAKHIDGRPMQEHAPIRCDACGARLFGIQAARGQWIAVSEPRGLGG
jgi:hypothetical protein